MFFWQQHRQIVIIIICFVERVIVLSKLCFISFIIHLMGSIQVRSFREIHCPTITSLEFVRFRDLKGSKVFKYLSNLIVKARIFLFRARYKWTKYEVKQPLSLRHQSNRKWLGHSLTDVPIETKLESVETLTPLVHRDSMAMEWGMEELELLVSVFSLWETWPWERVQGLFRFQVNASRWSLHPKIWEMRERES